MSAEYVKKVNDKPLAASEVAPTSPLKTTIDGKVSKSGDTMSGRLTLQKTLSQVITGTGTAATSSGSPVTYYPAKWKYDLGIATPVAGDQMVIQLPCAGHDYGVYLSTDNGTTYYPVAHGTGSSRCTTRYPSGAYVCVVFETFVSGNNNAGRVTDIFPVAGGTSRTTVTTGCWRIVNDYDSGNNYDRLYNANGRFYAGATGCSSYSLVCLDNTGKYSKLISSGTGTGNTKTVNTSGKFVFPSSVLYYAADNTVAANTLVTSTYATYIAYPNLDMRYSTNYNTSSNPAFTTNSPVYIECNINSDGTWSPTEKAITQTLVSGKYYIFLGITYSTAYQLSLAPNHPVFYYDGTNLVSAMLTKNSISASSTNGNISVAGTDVTVYTHPTQTAYSAKGSATKVPKITTDSTGHVTSIEEVTISGVTPASHSHGNIANGGTLTDTAAAAAGNDYVVIRDADNAKIQTSTIKGTDVADAVSKKHSHSTLTLSTTAQAYDGTHTLALPSSDPYTSARTPSSHTHGNIQNGGTLQPNDITIANGDKLVVTDASDSNKIARTSVSFDGSTVNKMLTQKGTFETVKEGNLEWGGRTWTGSYGPLDAALIDVLGANRFAFGNGDGVTVEYTRDGGTTWTDYGLTKEQRSAIFTLGQSVGIGKNDSNNKATADANWSNYKARITIQTGTFGVYTYLQKLAVYCSTNGSQGTRVVITARTRTDEQSDGAWTSIATASLAGWSGWNIIPVSFTTWGNAGSQYSQIRFLFEATQASAESQKQYNGFNVSKIFGYGGVGWTVPSTMAASGHMYTYDINKNVIFPAQVTATSFNGKFTTARKLAVSLSNTSTDTSFDGSADVTNIKTTGTLGVGNGGTGLTSVTSNSFLVGNGTGALVEKTAAQVLSLIGAQAAMTEMTTQEVTDFLTELGDF